MKKRRAIIVAYTENMRNLLSRRVPLLTIMAGVTGILTSLIMIAAVLYVATNFVLPMGKKAIGDVRDVVGFAGYEGYGQEF